MQIPLIVSPSLWSSHTPEIGERARSIPHDSVLDAVLCTDSRRPSDSAPDCTLSGPCSTNPDRSGDDPYEAPCEAELRNKTAAEVRAELFKGCCIGDFPYFGVRRLRRLFPLGAVLSVYAADVVVVVAPTRLRLYQTTADSVSRSTTSSESSARDAPFQGSTGEKKGKETGFPLSPSLRGNGNARFIVY